MSASSHPYYPLGANIVGYSPNQTSVLELLVSAGGGCAALLGLTFALASYVRPSLRMADRIAILWFVLCMTSPGAGAPKVGVKYLEEKPWRTKLIGEKIGTQ
jgi:hypothetical protein